MAFALRTEIEIAATPEEVWAVLTDLDRYAQWNSFITSAEGEVAVGQQLVNRIEPPGRRAMTFRPTVTEAEPARVFEWLGRFLLPRLFDGRHRFELEAMPDGGTRLIHGESFRGLLTPVLRRSLETSTLAGFEAMNRELKARVEQDVRAA